MSARLSPSLASFPSDSRREVGSPLPETPVEQIDEELMSEVQEGVRDGLSVLFRRYASVVRRVAIRILGDEAEAEDLVQELFLFIHRRAAIFDKSKCSARSWIVQMAYHRAIDRRRYLEARNHYHAAECDPESKLATIGDNSLDRSIASALDGRRLERALATLTRDQQQTLRLYFYDGYTLQEIAERLGQSIGNVRHHYYRGLDGLRKQVLRR